MIPLKTPTKQDILDGQLVAVFNASRDVLDPTVVLGVVDTIDEGTAYVRYAPDRYMKVPVTEVFPVQNELSLADFILGRDFTGGDAA
jgi:hypothetical protein